MNCPACGKAFPSGSVFCDHCGTQLERPKTSLKPIVLASVGVAFILGLLMFALMITAIRESRADRAAELAKPAEWKPMPEPPKAPIAPPAAPTPPAPKAVPTAAPVTAEALISAYKSNEVAADEQLLGKTVLVTGRVTNIAETWGNLTVSLGTRDEDAFEVISVICSFPSNERSAIARLSTDSVATLQGTVNGMTAGLYVGLDDCSVR